MNFSKKTHELVGQNEQVVKKSQKHDANLQKNSTLYFQVGLILTLLATYALFEMQFQTKHFEVIRKPIITDDTVYVNYVPEPIQTPDVEKKVEPVRKKLLAINFIQKKDDSPLKNITKSIITEPTTTTQPLVNVEPNAPTAPVKSAYSIIGVEQVPIYPGCEIFQSNDELRKCMSSKIGKLIGRKFNSDLLGGLGFTGEHKIDVKFKIDKFGNVIDVEARAFHSRLENEAIKVIGQIPKMIPAKQSNKEVVVMYSLPITLKVQ